MIITPILIAIAIIAMCKYFDSWHRDLEDPNYYEARRMYRTVKRKKS